MYRLVIFDLDGTLLNTIGDLAAAGNYTLERLGYPTHGEEEYKLFVGNGIPKLIERMLPKNCGEKEQNAALEIFGAYYSEHKSDRTVPYDGIKELLRELDSRGVVAVCNTNKAHEFSQTLIEAAFGGDIREVLGAGLGYPTKPDPSAAEALIKKYGVEKSEVLYVGDSSVDMMTARNAGIDACGVLWGFRSREELESYSPAFIAQNVSELRKIILGKTG